MKTAGLIGGMSWESTLEYYRIINEKIKENLWDLHSGKILLFSVNFSEIEKLQHEWKWDELTKYMIEIAKKLEKWWADFIVICTNTMHKMADEIEKNINIPIFHIADATAKEIKKSWLKKIWLLGTKFTMEQNFYKWRLENNHNLEIIVPSEEERNEVHRIIYDELCAGKVYENSKNIYKKIIENLIKNGAEAVILGCTEITLLIKQNDVSIPVFDTTLIHSEKIAEKMLEK